MICPISYNLLTASIAPDSGTALGHEHQILPRTVQLIAEGRLKIKGRKVEIEKGDSWRDKYEIIPDVLYPEGY